MNSKRAFPFLLLLLCLSPALAQKATYQETLVNLKTYPVSAPNPIPEVGAIYPYFRFDGYAATPSNRSWKMIEIENPYIKLWITPEIGGKIWGAIEKSTGRQFIYYNRVVKFRDLALRGPYTSGGMEFNFGIQGHGPTCTSPVDYLVRANPDGSVSCFLGAIDLPSRTRWSVEVALPGDKAYFTTRTRWDNSSQMEQSHYQWLNVGVKASGNLEYVYPGKYYLGHDGSAAAWPVDDKQRPISWYEKNDLEEYRSYHVAGSYTDFFGGYWHEDDFGFGHYGYYDDKPGKKIWIWGKSQRGSIWEGFLTDEDGQYTEMQSGRLFNQANPASTETPFKLRDFGPGTTDLFKEYWFPVNSTRGLKGALPDAAVNLTSEAGKLRLRLCPNSNLPSLIEVRAGEKTIFAKKVQMTPQKTVEFLLDSEATATECTVWLNGQLLYNGDPARNYTLRPTASPSTMDYSTAYGHYVRGKQVERQRRYAAAHSEYKTALDLDQHFVPAIGAMAHLFYRWADYDKSLEYALHALAIDTYDEVGNYFYGLSSLALGDVASALDGFSLAATSPRYRCAAYNAMAEIYLAKQDFGRSAEYAQRSLRYNVAGGRAQELEMMALRLAGQSEQAERRRIDMELEDPLNHFSRMERYVANPTAAKAAEVTKYITNEFPHQTFLENAMGYYRVRRFADAAEVLKISPPAAEVYYWLGYLSHLMGDGKNASEYVEKALRANAELVFPFRNESGVVLEWALAFKGHWKTRYYLGLVNLVQMDKEKTRSLWRDCGDMAEFYPFYVARARLELKEKPRDAERDLGLALRYGKGQWQCDKAVASAYAEMGELEKALDVAAKGYSGASSDYNIGLEYARYLSKAGRFEECTKVLKSLHVLPSENATVGRDVWRNANLNLAVDMFGEGKYTEALGFVAAAREFPTNLGVGKSYVVDERLEDFMAALCCAKLKKRVEADSFRQKVITAFLEQAGQFGRNSGDLIAALELRAEQGKEAGLKVMNDLERMRPNAQSTRWSRAIFDGDFDKADRISREDVAGEVLSVEPAYGILVRLQSECRVFERR